MDELNIKIFNHNTLQKCEPTEEHNRKENQILIKYGQYYFLHI